MPDGYLPDTHQSIMGENNGRHLEKCNYLKQPNACHYNFFWENTCWPMIFIFIFNFFLMLHHSLASQEGFIKH
jgi:hypothetical protein